MRIIVWLLTAAILAGCSHNDMGLGNLDYVSYAQQQQIEARADKELEALKVSGYKPLATLRNPDDLRLLFAKCDTGTDEACYKEGPKVDKPWIYVPLKEVPVSAQEPGEKFMFDKFLDFSVGIKNTASNSNHRIMCSPAGGFVFSSEAIKALPNIFRAEAFGNVTDTAQTAVVDDVSWSCKMKNMTKLVG